MTGWIRAFALAATVVVVACAGSAEPRAAAITLHDAWARPTAGAAEHAHGDAAHPASSHAAAGVRTAVYLTIRNDGDRPDRLIGATSPFAAAAEIHRTTIDDGVARMRPIDALEVPAGDSVQLRPGADHIMLLGLDRPLAAGDVVPVQLVFERAGELLVDADVRAR